MVEGMISVIVPVYLSKVFLEACVSSILAQTYSNLEVILVDDGSTDGSGDMCDAFAERDERVIVIHKANGGAASARNAGLDVAQGEFIGFVDSDDSIDADMYELLHKHIEEADADMSVCGLKMLFEGYTRTIGVPDEKKVSSATLWSLFLEDFRTYFSLFMGSCNRLIRGSLLKNLTTDLNIRFPEDMHQGEDGVFIADCVESADQGIVFVDFAPYNYSQTNNQVSLSKSGAYDSMNVAMAHIKDIMLKALPNRAIEIEKVINCQLYVNQIIAVHVAVINKIKPKTKLSRAIVMTILRDSNSREEKVSAILLMILPRNLYRAVFKLYCKGSM